MASVMCNMSGTFVMLTLLDPWDLSKTSNCNTKACVSGRPEVINFPLSESQQPWNMLWRNTGLSRLTNRLFELISQDQRIPCVGHLWGGWLTWEWHGPWIKTFKSLLTLQHYQIWFKHIFISKENMSGKANTLRKHYPKRTTTFTHIITFLFCISVYRYSSLCLY